MNGIEKTKQYGTPSLEGLIGKGRVATQKVVPNRPAEQAPKGPAVLRHDFAHELEARLGALVQGPAGQTLTLAGLDDEARKELKKLQGASEGFEAHFVKQLLSQMRQSSFAEKDSQTTSLAKDLMDQQIADQTAKGGNGLGIARMVFAKMGEQVVRQAAARLQAANASTDLR